MQPSLPIPSLPLLAEVRTPTGAVWYVPRALQHGPFLVQRRYVGVGATYYSNYSYSNRAEARMLYAQRERAVPVLVPYLNPGAVQAAGLDIAAIMAWSAQHPGQIFSHPTYAPLCLRWGDNAHEYSVTAHTPEATFAKEEILFTPSTCWLTGTTYYQVDADKIEEQVFTILVAQAGLLPHEQEFGLEGTWSGWCLTNIDAAAKILATTDHRVRIACLPLYYGAWLYPDAPGVIHWLNVSTTAEEALAIYQRLPEESNPSQAGSTVMWGYALGYPDQAPEWFSMSEKRIPFEYGVNLWHQRVVPYPNPVGTRQLFHSELAPVEAPLSMRIPTLREFMDAGSLSRWQLTQRMNWTAEKLMQVEDRPWELTLVEIRKLAKLLEVTEEKLVDNLQHELRAWEAMERQQERAERRALTKAMSNPS